MKQRLLHPNNDSIRFTYVLTHLVSNIFVEALLFLPDDLVLDLVHVLVLLDPLEVIGDHVLV